MLFTRWMFSCIMLHNINEPECVNNLASNATDCSWTKLIKNEFNAWLAQRNVNN